MPRLEHSHTFPGCASAVEEVKKLQSHQLKGPKKQPPLPIMSEAEASTLAAHEGLTLVKGPTNSGYTGVLHNKKVYTGRAAAKNRKPYSVHVRRGVGVGVGGNGDGDRQVEALRGPGRKQGRTKARSLYIGSFSSAHEAALAYARHLGAEQSAEVSRESARCGGCSGCTRRTDCGECKNCLDTIAAGGAVARIPFSQSRTGRQSCVQRACCNPLKAGAVDEWSRQKPVLKRAVELLLSKGVRATPPPPPPATPCNPPAAPCSQPAAPCGHPAAPRIPGPQLDHDEGCQGALAGAMRGRAQAGLRQGVAHDARRRPHREGSRRRRRRRVRRLLVRALERLREAAMRNGGEPGHGPGQGPAPAEQPSTRTTVYLSQCQSRRAGLARREERAPLRPPLGTRWSLVYCTYRSLSFSNKEGIQNPASADRCAPRARPRRRDSARK